MNTDIVPATDSLEGAPLLTEGADVSHITPPLTLSRKKKAALVISYLMQEGAEVPLSNLPSDIQTELIEEISQLRLVDKNTLDTTLEEFSEELSQVGLTMGGGLEGALGLLDGKISKETSLKLKKEAGVKQFANAWERLKAASEEDLLPIVLSESIEVSAVLLSKLEVLTAAAILGKLAGEQARKISYSISTTKNVTTEAADRIGQSLVAQLDNKPDLAFNKDPADRVGTILTETTQDVRIEVLAGLERTDPEFAERVRDAIFTFEDIPKRIAAKDVIHFVRKVELDALSTALTHAQSLGHFDVIEFILSNITSGMADMISEEMSEGGKVSLKEGEAAINAVLGSIQKAVALGDFKWIVEEE